MEQKQAVLVVQTAFLGDVLLGIPLLKQLRLLFPNREILILCRKGLGTLLRDLNLVDRAFEVKKGDAASYRKISLRLQQYSLELVLCPHPSLRSALFVNSIKARQKIGFKKWWNFSFYHRREDFPSALPEALRQLSLARSLSYELNSKLLAYEKNNSVASLGPVPDWASMLVKLPSAKQQTEQTPKSPYVCIFPGSVWATKRWVLEGFIEVAQNLQQQKFQVVIMGGPGEESLGTAILEKVPGTRDLVNKTNLLESLRILEGASLVITNDNGGQHLAAAVGVPTISIFGPTVISQGFRPWNSKAKVVENESLRCRPCGKHGHAKCPIGTHECMTSISATSVLAEMPLLGISPPKSPSL